MASPTNPKDHHPRKITPASTHSRRKPRRVKRRRLYCDCGQPAITVLLVKVGVNPQYLVQLPLCATCLAVEQSFK